MGNFRHYFRKVLLHSPLLNIMRGIRWMFSHYQPRHIPRIGYMYDIRANKLVESDLHISIRHKRGSCHVRTRRMRRDWIRGNRHNKFVIQQRRLSAVVWHSVGPGIAPIVSEAFKFHSPRINHLEGFQERKFFASFTF